MKNKQNLLNSIKLLMRISIIQGVLLLAFTCTLHAKEAISQGILEKTFSIQAENMPLSSVLRQIEQQTAVKFIYSPNSINAARKINYSATNEKIFGFLTSELKNYNITYRIIEEQVVLYAVGTSPNTHPPKTLPPEKVVSGRVTNDQGEPLTGVTVSEKGTRNATTTDDEGNYSLSVENNAIIEFSYVGYQTRELSAAGRQTLNVSLSRDVQDMSEVIVIGYGTQKRTSVTGAVEAVTSKVIEGRPVTNLSTALQGTAANLIIQQPNFEPGQGQSINIRGIGTLGDNSPLIVIDGISGGNINLLNPNDIESVSILKDAGTAAIYGSRSANGVILITTKKGKKNERPSLTYSGTYGIQMPRVTYKPVDAWENAYYKNISLVNSGLSPAFSPQQIRQFKEQGNGDWRVENIMQDAPQQSHNITFKGGGTNNTYLVSLGMMDQRSNYVGPNYGYKRYNIRFNQTAEIGKLKISTILAYTKVNNKDHASNTGNLIVDASRVPLYYNFQDSLGRYLTNPVSAELNPLGILRNGGYRFYNDDEVFGNLTAEYPIFKDLKIIGVAGGNVNANSAFEKRQEIKFYPGGASGTDRGIVDRAFKSLFSNVQLRAEYSKKIYRHDIGLMVGGANESYRGETMQIYKKFTDPALGIPVTGTVIDPGETYNTISQTNESSLNSLLGRATYAFDDKYFAEFDFRYDGSSKFAKPKRWGFFPSASVAWRVSQESFFEPLKEVVSELKLRASYGILGNQNVGAYQYQTTFFNYPNAYGFNNSVVGGSGFSFGNPDLTWEKAATTNLGLDISFFNRLTLGLDYFNKITSDILARRDDVPLIFGAGTPDYNIAKVRNRGWELRATYNHPGAIINHSFTFNLSDNLNELLQLTAGVREYSPFQKEEFQLLRRVGQPITTYYGYKTNGFFQNLEQINDVTGYPRFANSIVGPGDLMFVDKNKDGVINDQDKFILGNPFPRYTFGFIYNMTWKNLDFQLFIQGVGKRDQMIRGEQVEPFHFGYGGTMYEHQTDFWTPTNPDARWPRLAEAGSSANTNNYRVGSDIYLFNAAYARLKNVQIGYTIPQVLLDRVNIKRARFYLTGQNLYTLTKLTFLDPEITEFNNNTDPYGSGANSARAYFMPKFYGFGLDITF